MEKIYEKHNVPNHIAIILDGNSDVGQRNEECQNYGHVKGCANLENICYDIKDLGVKYLTVYAFPQKTGNAPEKKWKV